MLRKGLLITLCALFCAVGFAQKFTVVLDAGHGGHDPGAVGKISREKDNNLAVVLRVGALIEKNCPDVKVIYTRKTDVFVTLGGRAAVANKNKADLFISIHTNAATNPKAVGASTYTLGMHRAQSNLEVAKRENAVITYEENYEQKYSGFNPNKAESYVIFEFMQDKNMSQSVELARDVQKEFSAAGRLNAGVHQAGFLVLRETSMPAILVEMGFISNPNEEQFLASEGGRNVIAQSVYNGFVKYLKAHTRLHASPVPIQIITPPADPPAAKTETPKPAAETPAPAPEKPKAETKPAECKTVRDDAPVYKVQVYTSPKRLPTDASVFKGLEKVDFYQDGGLYKYTVGAVHTYKEGAALQRKVCATHADAFLVAFLHGKRVSISEARAAETR